MRLIIAVTGIVTAGAAGAHPLGTEQSLFAQLGHQMLSAHHLPLLVLVAAVAVIAAGRLLRRKQ